MCIRDRNDGEVAMYETPAPHTTPSQSTIAGGALSTGAQAGGSEGVTRSESPASQTAPFHSTGAAGTVITDPQAVIEGLAQLESFLHDDGSYYTASEGYLTALGSPMRTPSPPASGD